MLPAFYFATLFLLLVTLLPLWRNPHWLIRGLDFPRLQFATLAVALLFAELFLLDFSITASWALISLTTLCLIWHLRWIAPYTTIWPVEVNASNQISHSGKLSIITANVLASNRQANLLINLVNQHQPDVLVTLESDDWWQDQLSALESEMPYTIKCALDNLYGMHVYSRLPLNDSEVSFLVEDDIPSIHTLLKLRTGHFVRMHFLHPAPPSPSENEQSIERDAELVIIAKSVAETNQPIIVTGDLNDVAWSPTTRLFRKISGLLDPRIGRGIYNTYHASYPFFRWPLDHLFHSNHFTVDDIQRLPPIGSDHFALLTKLSFSDLQHKKQHGISADSSDEAWASRIADDEKVSEKDVPTPGN